MPGVARWLPGLVFAAALLLFPAVVRNPYYIHLIVVVAIYAILLLGLDIVVGYTGEVSLGHAALFGIGAYTTGVLRFQFGIIPGIEWTIPLAILVTALFGAVLALPALRVTGPYLAMVTLAFGTIVQILINEMDFLTNGPLGVTIRKPVYFGHRVTATEFYYIAIAFMGLTVLVVNNILRSHLGRAFQALRDSPIASDCMAVSVYRHKVMAFVISAGLAGMAGALFAFSEEYISPNTYSFDLTILFLLAVTLGGRKSRSGPILGAAIVVFLPNLLADIFLFRVIAGLIAAAALGYGAVAMRRRPAETGPGRLQAMIPVALCLVFFVVSLLMRDVSDYRLTIYGLMILFVVFYLPDGLIGFIRSALGRDRSRGEHLAPVAAEPAAPWAGVARSGVGGTEGPLLQAKGLVMQFGGLKALDAVDLSISPGIIHGLIGPNGSGKSTMMNVLTGIYRATAGEIRFDGRPIAGLPPARIAGAGIARTFQNVQLFGEMTALENVLVGLHHAYRSTIAAVVLRTPGWRREEAAARARAMGLLAFVGLAASAEEEARNLPYGKQRLLEIARALALDPRLLLLDEPAAGLTAADIGELMTIIRKIRETGITVILIEHHMDVVMGLCDRVSVLDFGHKIAEGRPAEVQADPKVLEAYLGAPASEVA